MIGKLMMFCSSIGVGVLRMRLMVWLLIFFIFLMFEI